ncbi:MAG: SH3 domain-containing protein [Chitinophagaceae bacterium]
MMKKYLLLVSLVAVFLSAYSQGELTTQYCYAFEKGTSTYTFNDSMNLRTAPRLKAAVRDTLAMGTEVFIDEKIDSLMTASGKEAPWYLVHYTKNTENRTGYVWGGNLCLNPMRRTDIKFLIGLKGLAKRKSKGSNESFDVMVAELKVLRNDSLLDRVSWDLWSTEGFAYNGSRVLPASGLKDVKYLLQTLFSGGACGIPTITQYLAWTGEKLLLLPQLMSVADAGVFSHDEQFVFPTDKNGKPGTIIKTIEDEETDEKEHTTSKKSTMRFIWNGEKAIKQ